MICDLRSVGTVKIKCHVFKNINNSEIQSLELHGFGDSSSVPFAAAVYLRTEMKSLEIDTNLISSKARLAPLKGETVPRIDVRLNSFKIDHYLIQCLEKYSKCR